jgi:anti-anti-sigma factor
MKDLIAEGAFVYLYGVFYPVGDAYVYEAKHVQFLGTDGDYVIERPEWWVNQVREFADFYLRAEFGDGPIDYRQYRTKLNLSGERMQDARQETDTLSRLVYGFATAYLMTGEDRFLEAAEKGTEYLREHMRFEDPTEDVVYWYHAVDVDGGTEKKIFASEFGDDFDALPCYEQIYAIAGPTQTYRVTGDPLILSDIEKTVNLFEKFYKDTEREGYWSHIDPITMDGQAQSLDRNRARKNWNSVGDHIPAYLINVWLATEDPRWKTMLEYCADLIVKYLPDDEESPFVQEKFHADWSKDQTWGWQQNRAVVGHNLKIAWNLMRLYSMSPKAEYLELARKIADTMPKAGMDPQRGGWYDVVDRVVREGETVPRFVWHDRKAWWQQEQGILAYLILGGALQEPEYQRLGRESSAFYNAMFLDHDDGAVYFNVLANGIPWLVGLERLKGSHSMGGYHSTELAYLAAAYTNLLIMKEPMDLHFKPKAGAFKDNVLRVAPDILPVGSIRIGSVWVDGEEYSDFDAEGLTVKLPETEADVKVKVRVVPAGDPFDVRTEVAEGIAQIHIQGRMDATSIEAFERELQEAVDSAPKALVFRLEGLQELTSAGLRGIAFARSKLGQGLHIYVVGAQEEVAKLFQQGDVAEDLTLLEAYDPAKIT